MRSRISVIICIMLAVLLVLSAPLMAGAAYTPVTLEDIEEAAESSAVLAEEWFGTTDGIIYLDTYEGEKLDGTVLETLALYKAFREGNYLKHGAESVALQRGLFAFVDVSKALDEYNARATMLDEMEERMLVEIVGADVTLKLVGSEKENGKLILHVNEWTFFDYDDLEGEGDAIDVSGYGVDHTITLAKTGDTWLIEEDYFEDTLMGLPEGESEQPTKATKSLKDGGLRQAGASAINGKLTQTASYTIYTGYSPANAVEYSEKWVYHSPSSGVYESYYNPAWPNYNSVGGDCANYTSQCIYAGGMPMADGVQYGTDGWFHYSSTNRSGSWTGAKQLRTYMMQKRGQVIDNPSNSQVWMGCPMFVDWYSDGSYDHAYFCVGQNSSGTAIINSHNSDKYHVKWNYGYSSSTYSTVQITTSNHVYPTDTTNPTISNITISNMSSTGYRVSCTVSDDVGVTRVEFPTWTNENGQDDLKWHAGTISGNTAYCDIKISDHNNETGAYTTHVYAYDAAGNSISAGAPAIDMTPDNTEPSITEYSITNVTSFGFDVSYKATDNVGVTETRFAVWSSANGQDDLIWYTPTMSNGYGTVHISTSKHNSETGGFNVHIYAWDAWQNSKCVTLSVNVPTPAYPTDADYIPINAINASQYESNSMVWTTGTFTAQYWGVLTLKEEGSNWVVSGKYESGVAKSVTASASNPVIAVHSAQSCYAAFGAVEVGDTVSLEGVSLSEGVVLAKAYVKLPQKFELNDNSSYVLGDKYVDKITRNTTVGTIAAAFKCTVKVYNQGGVEVSASELCGTGYTVRRLSTTGAVLNSVEVVVSGDLNSDGSVSTADYLVANGTMTQTTAAFKDAFFEASDLNGDNSFSAADCLILQSMLVGQ